MMILYLIKNRNKTKKNMKSEIIEKEKSQKFPCLMIGKETGNVYLMSCMKTGVCIAVPENSVRNAGEYSSTLDASLLTPFKGKIILQND